eukprot:10953372-Prorocentrum_lima.AAC.1
MDPHRHIPCTAGNAEVLRHLVHFLRCPQAAAGDFSFTVLPPTAPATLPQMRVSSTSSVAVLRPRGKLIKLSSLLGLGLYARPPNG